MIVYISYDGYIYRYLLNSVTDLGD